ncbi:MAG: helicase-associated domain-containing protein [Phycisphaeraceae bacterium]
MRSFNIDWSDLADVVPLWRSLGGPSKHRLLHMKSTEVVPARHLEEGDPQKLIEHGLMSMTKDKTRLRIAPAGRGPLKALRAMYRTRLDDGEVLHNNLQHYVREVLTEHEAAALLPSQRDSGYRGLSRRYDPPQVEKAGRQHWIESWLELEDAASARQWERTRLPPGPPSSQMKDGSPYFDDEALFHATRRLVEQAMTWDRSVPLDELPDRVPELDPELLWRAVVPAIRYLLLFPRLEDDTYAPRIGLWPTIAWRLHRPEARPPAPIEPTEVFHRPYRVEDITVALVAAAASPLRMLASENGLYQKEYARIAEAMTSAPPWLLRDPQLEEMWIDRKPADERFIVSRIDSAIHACVSKELLDVNSEGKGPTCFEITEEGRSWLDLGLKQQIKLMAEPLRESTSAGSAADPLDSDADEEEDFEKEYGPTRYHISTDGSMYLVPAEDASPWTPREFSWVLDPSTTEVDWRAAIVDALTDPDDRHFRPVGSWVEYHGRENNPLLGRRRAGGDYGPVPDLSSMHIYRLPDETMIEQFWAEHLLDMMTQKLLPIGGIEVGFDGEDRCIRLHDIGRYVLGLIDDFECEAAGEGEVIVQPDFEVLFMGPAPAAEARIAPLAERTGQRMGTMFRLTRKSVQDAAAAGIARDRALADLESLSARPLPDNVRRQIADWFDATASVKLREAWLVDAPDTETADRVETAAGKHVRRLAPTTFEVTATRANQSALRRKLKDAGVFVK